MFKLLLVTLVFICIVNKSNCQNKYSAQANMRYADPPVALRTIDKPFRMAKLNLLWSKAVLRLTDPKLQSLFEELKIHDKEELTHKHIKSEGKDKEGLKEAELRKKLVGIMSSYDLLEHFEDVHNVKKHKDHEAYNESNKKYMSKTFFKDKKLNKLWEKAEHAGFTNEELKVLKEEFYHHQSKIDQYYNLLDDVETRKDDHENSIDEALDRFNALETNEEELTPQKNHIEKANVLRDKHRDLRDGYDRLHRLASKGPKSREFLEPKVQGLWKIALASNFTVDELESLRIELKHYEARLQKLHLLKTEAAMGAKRHENKQKLAGEKPEAVRIMEETINKQARKVDFLHNDIESRIRSRHAEL